MGVLESINGVVIHHRRCSLRSEAATFTGVISFCCNTKAVHTLEQLLDILYLCQKMSKSTSKTVDENVRYYLHKRGLRQLTFIVLCVDDLCKIHWRPNTETRPVAKRNIVRYG